YISTKSKKKSFNRVPDDLSEVLTAGTKESHDKAENSPFVKDFLRGRIKQELFKVSLVFMDSYREEQEPPHVYLLLCVEHIHEVGRDDPVLLVAHAWTRYMGDLSGGQILKKGVNFYHFEGTHNPTAFKRLYRSRMNELEVNTETKKKLLDKANLAFKYNLDVRGLSNMTSFYWFVKEGIVHLKMKMCL
uniref:Heme oxygenase 2a n=1 Tax=Sinocyclocheilus grahami TaxID=75366 RepID=A0A672TBE1_SINGR